MNLQIHRGTSYSEIIPIQSMVDPQLLANAIFVMQFRKKTNGKKVLLELTSDNGGLICMPDMAALVISIAPEDTMNLKVNCLFYDCIAIIPSSFGPEVKFIVGGMAEIYDLVTRIPGISAPQETVSNNLGA